MKGVEAILLFLEKFVCKIMEKKGVILKFYQCPKCYQKGKSDIIQHPVNFLGHLIGECKDWYAFVPEDEKILFLETKETLNETLKKFMNELMEKIPAK